MNKTLIYIILPLLLMGCSQKQYNAYPMDEELRRNKQLPKIRLTIKSKKAVIKEEKVAVKDESPVFTDKIAALKDKSPALMEKKVVLKDKGPDIKHIKVALVVRDKSAHEESIMVLVSRRLDLDHMVNDDVIDQTKKDLEIFYITAKHLRLSNMSEDLELFAGVAKEYLAKRIDPLIMKNNNGQAPEVRIALTELQYYKAHLLYEIEDIEGACATVSDLESSENFKAEEDLKILSNRFNESKNPYLITSDFSYMCKR